MTNLSRARLREEDVTSATLLKDMLNQLSATNRLTHKPVR